MPAEAYQMGQSILIPRGVDQRPLTIDFAEHHIIDWRAVGRIVTVELDRWEGLPPRTERYSPPGLQWDIAMNLPDRSKSEMTIVHTVYATAFTSFVRDVFDGC